MTGTNKITSLAFTLAVLLATLPLDANARMVQVGHAKRGNIAHLHQLERRQVDIPVDGQSTAAASSPTAAAAQPSSAAANNGGVLPPDVSSQATQQSQTTGGLLDTLLNPGRSSVDPLGLLSSSASSSAALSISSSVPASSSASSTRSTSVSQSANVGTVNIFSTQQPSATPEASESSKPTEEHSGIGKKTLIIVGSVAGAIGLIAAIWTIMRKWKFSPSRRFEQRLNPIDWTADTAANNEKMHSPDMMHRTGSEDSLSLKRGNSWGSAAGSQRGLMSEVGYSRGNNMNFNVAPAYPPVYNSPPLGNEHMPEYQTQPQQQYAAAPYEQVTRQASQVHGGRYGEGYNRF